MTRTAEGPPAPPDHPRGVMTGPGEPGLTLTPGAMLDPASRAYAEMYPGLELTLIKRRLPPAGSMPGMTWDFSFEP